MEWLLVLVGLVIAAAIYRKIVHVDQRVGEVGRRLEAAIAKQFRQIEALQALYVELQPPSSLPATRGWAGSPDFLLALARHVLAERPLAVLECGSGVTTVVIARALQKNGHGHLWSLDHDARFADATRREITRQGLDRWATLIDAPLVSVGCEAGEQPWYDPAALPDGPFDLLVVDGPPGGVAPLARLPAGERLFPRLRPEGVVFLDDAGRSDEREIVRRWTTRWPAWTATSHATERGLVVLRRVEKGIDLAT